MTTIVLDANAMPHGHFSLHALNAIHEIAGSWAEIFVPEVVVWEWAEHAVAAHVALEEYSKRFRVERALTAHPVVAPVESVDAIVSSIEALLPRHTKVWMPTQDVWRSAVRDQVLQVGAGETKGDVKTGAADAVVWACVRKAAEDSREAVVLITSDRHLKRYVLAQARREQLDNVRGASGTGELLKALGTFVPASDELELRLEEDLPVFLNERYGDYGESIRLNEIGIALESNGELYDVDGKNGLSSLAITHVDIAEAHEFEVEAGDDGRRALVGLRLFGKIVGEVLAYSVGPDGETAASRQLVDFSSHFVDVRVAVLWNHHWRIQSVFPTGVSVLVLDGRDEEESDDVPAFRARSVR